MKKVIDTEDRAIKLWLDDIEDGALAQARNLANLPFLHKHVAIMPDSHQGYGMPIGAVIACDGVIIPNAVGVDIGCGMVTVRTSLNNLSTDELKAIMGGSKKNKGGIRSCIPVGMNRQSKKQKDWLTDKEKGDLSGWSVVEKEYQSSLKQIGTLGGGNHFIEIQKGDDGFVWVMIHSGSRNMGYTVAKHYNNIAEIENARWFSSVPRKHGLAFLPLGTCAGELYLKEMNACVKFAFKNRSLMMKNVKDSISCILPDVEFGEMINVSHNFAAIENHFGKNVMIHRKGATRARNGEYGIIPGSQGSKSYIVNGKGNPDSFESCSHGAGRKMSRTRAQKDLDFDEQVELLDEIGVVHGMRSAKDLDEAPGAYKDINEVMNNQKDLVDIAVELTPLAVIKG